MHVAEHTMVCHTLVFADIFDGFAGTDDDATALGI